MKSEIQNTITCIYLVQMLGNPTVKQVRSVANRKMGLRLTEIDTKNALDAAKKRGILSIGHRQDSKTEEVFDCYSMKDVRFANPPEVAHLKNVLPVLLKDKENKYIFDILDGIHEVGDRKSGSFPDICDYQTIEVSFENVLPVVGGQPYQQSRGEVEAIRTLRRVGRKIWVPGNLWLRAAIRNKLRQYNISESKALYIEISDYFFVPKKRPFQIVLPSPPQRKGGQGTGLCPHEALYPGESFTFKIRFPTKNGIPPNIMEEILSNDLRIGAKSKDYGLLVRKR